MKNNKVYAFIFCPCVHESAWITISLHWTREGAQKALEFHKQEESDSYDIMFGNDADWTELGFKFDSYKSWDIEEVKILE